MFCTTKFETDRSRSSSSCPSSARSCVAARVGFGKQLLEGWSPSEKFIPFADAFSRAVPLQLLLRKTGHPEGEEFIRLQS